MKKKVNIVYKFLIIAIANGCLNWYFLLSYVFIIYQSIWIHAFEFLAMTQK